MDKIDSSVLYKGVVSSVSLKNCSQVVNMTTILFVRAKTALV